MDRFAQFAFSLTLRDASFVALAALTLMLGFSFNPPLAFMIGAHIALIFSLLLLYRVSLLTEERIRRTEAWRVLEPHERPHGEFALTMAHQRLKEVLLRFAKTSAGVACTLFVLSLGTSLICTGQCGYTGL